MICGVFLSICNDIYVHFANIAKTSDVIIKKQSEVLRLEEAFLAKIIKYQSSRSLKYLQLNDSRNQQL